MHRLGMITPAQLVSTLGCYGAGMLIGAGWHA
jgi:hypothetical protein